MSAIDASEELPQPTTPAPPKVAEDKKWPWGCSSGCFVFVVAVIFAGVIGFMEKGGSEPPKRRSAIGVGNRVPVETEQRSLAGRFLVKDITVSLTDESGNTLPVELERVAGELDWGGTITVERVGLLRGTVPVGSVNENIEFDLHVKMPDDESLVGQTGLLSWTGTLAYPVARQDKDGFDERTNKFEGSRKLLFVATPGDLEEKFGWSDWVGNGLLLIATILLLIGAAQRFMQIE